MAGDAGTLRDYWEGHGHSGPSHGAERDAIAWGTPGDFMRCVAQVTEHGHMTPEQAKGYCNLRHHGALGTWPAQHAAAEKAQSSSQQQDGGSEARVAAGSGATSGQWTAGSDGPTQNKPKPNPYANGKKKAGSKKGPGGKKKPPGSKKPKKTGAARPRATRAQLKKKIAGLEKRLGALLAEERSLRASPVSGAASTSTGTQSSAVTPGATSQSSSQSSSSSSKPAAAGTKTAQLQQVRKQIAQIRAEIKQDRQQMQTAKAWEADATKASRNQRDVPTGRFRTFEGESKEASRAFAEGRVHDAVDFLGSARALANEPGHRTILGSLQQSIGRVQHVIPDVTKSFIRGDSIAHGDKTGFHEGSAGGGHIYMRTRDGVRYRVPKKEVRAARDDENEDLYREETDPGLPEPPEARETAKKGPVGLTGSQAAWFNRSMPQNQANKVGPKGYVHGWIKVGAGEAPHPGKEHADYLVGAADEDGMAVPEHAADLSNDELRSAHEYLASKPDKTSTEDQVQDYLEQELDAIESNPAAFGEDPDEIDWAAMGVDPPVSESVPWNPQANPDPHWNS